MKNILLIAIALQSVNAAYCRSIGDDSHKPWAELPKVQQDGYKMAVEKLLANPDMTHEDLHNEWAASKLAQGWTYGETKDEQLKTHPQLVEYSKLPPEQRSKDAIAKAVVLALAAIPDAAPAKPTEATKPGFTAVRYIHRDPDYTDRLYGTGLMFEHDQVRNLPDVIAEKFLRHQDLFERAEPVVAEDTDTAEKLQANLTEQQALDQRQVEINALRDQINSLPTKAALIEFAQTRFQQQLEQDPAKHKLDALRQQVLGYVDLYA